MSTSAITRLIAFGAIDPYGAAFRERCAAARASKLRLG